MNFGLKINKNSNVQNSKNQFTTPIKNQYSEIEEVAKEHAQQFINLPTEGMNTQQKLFEVRAHEQDLRKEGMSEEADYYIKMFEKHLNDYNPELAKLIIKK